MLLTLKDFLPRELCLIIDGVEPPELSPIKEEDQGVTLPVQLAD